MKLSASQDLILIVDDKLHNLEVLSETLSDQGFEVAVAISGERALMQIQRCFPDLILLDIIMPGMGGLETCKQIKADQNICDIPVIFMSALTDVEQKVNGFNLGAVDYITKPFCEEEVLSRVKTHLALRKTQLQLQASEQRLSNILYSLKEVVWSAALEPFELLYLNPAVEAIYGKNPKTFIENPELWVKMIYIEDRSQVSTNLMNLQPSSSVNLEYRIQRDGGDIRWVRCQAQAYLDSSLKRICLDGIVQDITDHKKAELQLRYSAQHDSLTNLANRAYFIDQLRKTLSYPLNRQEDRFALLFIDLDRFKSINDSLGHSIGDQLLVKVSQILHDSVRPSDLVARLGGDEFTVLLRKVADVESVIRVSNRIKEKLQHPIQLEGHRLIITASIGIVMNSGTYQLAEEMLRDADIAMYQAKNLGKACHQLFSQEMYEKALYKLTLENELATALEKEEFFLTYQPIKKLQTNELAGFEALVRWQHPSRGLVAPTEFIPLAEETGLIVTLGDYILRKACIQMKQWQQITAQVSQLTMSVNLSGHQLQDENFLDTLKKILSESELDTFNLKLEITESSLMENSDLNLQILEIIKQQGIRLSLDDFGTGYSSLSYLHKFPVNTLKIDRSFIQAMEPGVSSFEIVRAIAALAGTLKLDVVAEGVETAAQVKYLKSLGCDMVQGYFFSKPLSAEAATDYIHQEFNVTQN